jgi:predicted nucleic acid-binding Zn ribbon protein
MPLYVYRMTESPLTDCPECEGHIYRVIQPVGVVFKGSGFYVTDNHRPSSTASAKRDVDDAGSSAKDGGSASKAED